MKRGSSFENPLENHGKTESIYPAMYMYVCMYQGIILMAPSPYYELGAKALSTLKKYKK